jgi:hypothetical protein
LTLNIEHTHDVNYTIGIAAEVLTPVKGGAVITSAPPQTILPGTLPAGTDNLTVTGITWAIFGPNYPVNNIVNFEVTVSLTDTVTGATTMGQFPYKNNPDSVPRMP